MFVTGIVVFLVSLAVERTVSIRTRQLVGRAGGDWQRGDVRYADEGGAPRSLSALALLAYVGMLVGVVLIVVGLVT